MCIYHKPWWVVSQLSSGAGCEEAQAVLEALPADVIGPVKSSLASEATIEAVAQHGPVDQLPLDGTLDLHFLFQILCQQEWSRMRFAKSTGLFSGVRIQICLFEDFVWINVFFKEKLQGNHRKPPRIGWGSSPWFRVHSPLHQSIDHQEIPMIGGKIHHLLPHDSHVVA